MEKQKTLLIGVNLNDHKNFNEEMAELESLALSNDYLVVGKIVQNLKEINTVFYIGPGKLEEIKSFINENNVEVIIVNSELSPGQIKNLEKELKVEVIDRTLLILYIFTNRASSKEAQIQVRMAYLNYMLPKLIGSNTSLDRQRGGKNKGLGETKLELDRRRILKELSRLKKELRQVEKQTLVKNKQKDNSSFPKVALVGYTNAGKSSLMNLFIDLFMKDENKKVFEKDLLFATLDTTSRRITIDDYKTLILSDTVGFISSLPTQLIESFNSTLKSVKNADLLLHVMDFSSPNLLVQKQVTLDTLKLIGADNIPIINIYNKIDLPSPNFIEKDPHSVFISCRSREGVDELISLLNEILFNNFKICKIFVPYEDVEILAYFSKNAKIISKIEKESGFEIDLSCHKNDYYRFAKYVINR